MRGEPNDQIPEMSEPRRTPRAGNVNLPTLAEVAEPIGDAPSEYDSHDEYQWEEDQTEATQEPLLTKPNETTSDLRDLLVSLQELSVLQQRSMMQQQNLLQKLLTRPVHVADTTPTSASKRITDTSNENPRKGVRPVADFPEPSGEDPTTVGPGAEPSPSDAGLHPASGAPQTGGAVQITAPTATKSVMGVKGNDSSLIRVPKDEPQPFRAVKLTVPSHLTYNISSKTNMLPQNFLQSMEDQLALAGCSNDTQRLACVTSFLAGASNEWWWNNRQSLHIDTFEKFKVAFLEHAMDAGEIDRRRRAYEAVTHQRSQSVRNFAERLRTAADMLPINERPTDQQLAFRFRARIMENYRHSLNQYYSMTRPMPTFQQCVDYVVRLAAQPGEQESDSNKERRDAAEPALHFMDSKQSKTKDELLRAGIAKLKNKGVKTLHELRAGDPLNRLNREQRDLARRLQICASCRVGIHPNTRDQPCPHAQEIHDLLGKIRTGGSPAKPKNE